MKTCYKCKVDKEITEFHKDKTTKDGLCSQCKTCKKQYCDSRAGLKAEYDRIYRPLHKEQGKTHNRRYREKHHYKEIERSKKYREAFPEKTKESQRKPKNLRENIQKTIVIKSMPVKEIA